jgi:hypothetical protein
MQVLLFQMFKLLLSLMTWCSLAASLLASGGGGGCGGGGMGSCGFGDSGPIFPLPRVEEDVKVGGIILRLDREKWGYSVFAAAKEGVLARFSTGDIEVTLRRVAPMRDDERALIQRLRSRADVLYVRSVATSGGLRGVKVSFGLAPREQSAVRYFMAVSAKDWLCFEARPIGRTPQWQDASELILGAKFDRS